MANQNAKKRHSRVPALGLTAHCNSYSALFKRELTELTELTELQEDN